MPCATAFLSKTSGELSATEADGIENAENAVDAMCGKMKEAHVRRTNEGRCSPEAGSVYLQLAVNMERIGDHMNNIANSIKTYVQPDA